MGGGDPDYRYAEAKFTEAVYALVGSGGLKEWLFGAFTRLIVIQSQDLPEHLRVEYAELLEVLTGLPPEQSDHGTLLSALEAISVEEADRQARKILDIYIRVKEAPYEQ